MLLKAEALDDSKYFCLFLLFLFSPFNVQLDNLWPSRRRRSCSLRAVCSRDDECRPLITGHAMGSAVQDHPSLIDRAQTLAEARDRGHSNLLAAQLQIARKRSLVFVG